MLDKLLDIFKMLFRIWESLPDENKETLKKNAGEVLDPFFRKFYQSEKNSETA